MRNKKKYTLNCTLLLLSNVFIIQTNEAQDTISIKLKEFVITDKRFEKYPGILYQNIDTLFSKIYSSHTLAAAIEYQSGAYLRSYGNGATSTVSFRGTGGDKTNVLWNGFHINSGSLGSFDLSLLPISHADNLEIAYGSTASSFGNASMGATIIMEHRSKYQSSLKIQSKQDFGSYGSIANSSLVEISNSKISSYSGFSWQQSTNNFLYQDKSKPGYPWLPMPQAEFNQITASQFLFFKLNNHNEIGVLLNYNQQYRQIPPPIGATLNQAAQFDRNIRAAFTGKHILRKSSHLFTQWGVGYFMDELNYSDKNLNDSSRIHQAQAYFIQKWGGWKKVHIEWGFHYQLFVPLIQQYQQNISEHRISLMLQSIWEPLKWLSLFYSVRQQISPGFSPPITGALGSEWKIFHQTKQQFTLRTIFNNGYRLPTLNDRYWSPGGNPNLSPELSWNLEGGIKYQLNLNKFSFSADLNGYSMWINDWIAWMPQSEGYWSPVNIKFVRLAGFESLFSLRSNLSHHFLWKFSTQYTFTSAQELINNPEHHQMIYVPMHTANATIFFDYHGFFTFIASKFCSQRFIRTDNSLSLPAYFLADATFGKKFQTRWFNIVAQFTVRNFTNTQYQSMENRPMPGIQWLVSFSVEWNKNFVKP